MTWTYSRYQENHVCSNSIVYLFLDFVVAQNNSTRLMVVWTHMRARKSMVPSGVKVWFFIPVSASNIFVEQEAMVKHHLCMLIGIVTCLSMYMHRQAWKLCCCNVNLRHFLLGCPRKRWNKCMNGAIMAQVSILEWESYW